jgi:hypothetical protein
MAMLICTITLIAIPIATGLVRNMLTLIATSMITTTATSMIFIRITTMNHEHMSIMPIRIRTLPMAMNTAMATITTIMG